MVEPPPVIAKRSSRRDACPVGILLLGRARQPVDYSDYDTVRGSDKSLRVVPDEMRDPDVQLPAVAPPTVRSHHRLRLHLNDFEFSQPETPTNPHQALRPLVSLMLRLCHGGSR